MIETNISTAQNKLVLDVLPFENEDILSKPKIRKGHWRNQPYSVERLYRRKIWVKTQVLMPDGKKYKINDTPTKIAKTPEQKEMYLE